jgi:membrane protease YdiL (CAAX protease family)
MRNSGFIRSTIIIITFLFAVYGRKVFFSFTGISVDSYPVRLLFHFGWWTIPVLAVTGILYGYKNILKELCIDKGVLAGVAFATITVLPMFVSSAIAGKPSDSTSGLELISNTFFSGFFEELVFRGFLFGLLFRKLNWGFVPAAVLGAIIFGSGHLYQGSSFAETTGVFLVTFLGGAWFAWLFIEWKENLWVPIFLHVFMNLSWILFDIGENALGNFFTNIFRVVTIAFTIVGTIFYNRKFDYFRITKENLIINNK